MCAPMWPKLDPHRFCRGHGTVSPCVRHGVLAAGLAGAIRLPMVAAGFPVGVGGAGGLTAQQIARPRGGHGRLPAGSSTGGATGARAAVADSPAACSSGVWFRGDFQRLGVRAPYVHDRPDHGVRACCWRCAVNDADRVIRWSTALAVLGVAAVAATASYEHAYDLVRDQELG